MIYSIIHLYLITVLEKYLLANIIICQNLGNVWKKKIKIGLENIFFPMQGIVLFFIFYLNLSKRYRNEMADSKKYALASTSQFPTKSIFRTVVFTSATKNEIELFGRVHSTNFRNSQIWNRKLPLWQRLTVKKHVLLNFTAIWKRLKIMIRIFVPRMNSSQARVLKEKYLGKKLRNIRELQGFLVIGFLSI